MYCLRVMFILLHRSCYVFSPPIYRANVIFQVFIPAVAYDSQRYAEHEKEQHESKQTGTTFVNTRDEMYLALVRFAGLMKRTAEQLEGITYLVTTTTVNYHNNIP